MWKDSFIYSNLSAFFWSKWKTTEKLLVSGNTTGGDIRPPPLGQHEPLIMFQNQKVNKYEQLHILYGQTFVSIQCNDSLLKVKSFSISIIVLYCTLYLIFFLCPSFCLCIYLSLITSILWTVCPCWEIKDFHDFPILLQN